MKKILLPFILKPMLQWLIAGALLVSFTGCSHLSRYQSSSEKESVVAQRKSIFDVEVAGVSIGSIPNFVECQTLPRQPLNERPTCISYTRMVNNILKATLYLNPNEPSNHLYTVDWIGLELFEGRISKIVANIPQGMAEQDQVLNDLKRQLGAPTTFEVDDGKSTPVNAFSTGYPAGTYLVDWSLENGVLLYSGAFLDHRGEVGPGTIIIILMPD